MANQREEPTSLLLFLTNMLGSVSLTLWCSANDWRVVTLCRVSPRYSECSPFVGQSTISKR